MTMPIELQRETAWRIANKIKCFRIDREFYQNKRECPYYSEYKGMLQMLKLMQIPYSFEFDPETYEEISVTVGECTETI